MLERCYSKKKHKKRPTYVESYVDNRWHNFKTFAEWSECNWKHWMDETWHLDKDILIKGNKIYSPETCCFVPRTINTLFTKSEAKRGDYPIGVSKEKNYRKFKATFKKTTLGRYTTAEEAFQAYKDAKEKYIKEVADKWKGLISDKVYQAMYNYQVEITD